MSAERDCLCHRSVHVKPRGPAILDALADEYAVCFAEETRNHPQIVHACRTTVLGIALSTIIPLVHPPAVEAIQTSHVVVNAMAHKFCTHLTHGWFAMGNGKLIDTLEALQRRRDQQLPEIKRNGDPQHVAETVIPQRGIGLVRAPSIDIE